MSAEMRSFMEAYGAVHSKEVKENLDSGRDSISEMNLSKMTESDLCEAVEEVLEVWFAEGKTVAECEVIVETILPSSEIPGRQGKIERLLEAFGAVIGRVKEKSARTAVESFALYRKGKQVKESWSNKFSAENGNEKLHERLVAADFAGVKNGLLELAKKPEFAGNYEGPLYAQHPDLAEGIRDKDPEKGTKERKERLEKKRDMKLDDHPEYKKEELEVSQIRKDWAEAYVGIYEKKMDPVGKEDEDIDNDGDVDSSDKYLHNRRKAIGKAIGKKGKCEKCGKDPCECDKEEVKEENWIKGAIKKPGALKRELGVPEDEKIPAAKLKKAEKAGGKLGQRARLAATLKGLNKEEVDWEFLDNLIESGKFTEEQIEKIAKDL